MFENFISWLDNNDILYHDFLQMKEVVINLNYSRSKKIIIETGSGLRSCYFIC